MGPKASTPADNNSAIKINHPIFAIAQLIKSRQDQQLIRTQVRLANKKQFDSWAKHLDDVPANQSLMLPVQKSYSQQGMCGSSGVANIIYDNFPYLLSDQISNRQCLNKKLFQENQLWYLVYTLLSAAFTYHKQHFKVGDIRPDNIFINQDGQVKVASVDSWPGQQTNYSKSFYQKQITYLSPQQIKDYQFGKMEESVDKQLAQTFSIGLTCLDAATLSQSKSLYSKNFKFNYEKLQMRLSDFRKYGYSELLTLTIENMCQVDTEFRSSSQEILNWLLPHEQAIINLQDFEVNGIPQKMKLFRQRNTNIQQVQTGPILYHPVSNIQASNYLPSSSSYVPSSVYNVPAGINVPTLSHPVQKAHYQPPPGMFIKNQTSTVQMINQPSSYQVNNIQSQDPFNALQGGSNYYTINSGGVDVHKSTLQKIDQQLQESRKLFPS